MKNNQPICETDLFGNKSWYLNDPIINTNVVKYYQLHREDGPAIERFDGYKAWYFHDQRHRLDGPAMEFPSGEKYWYYHGKQICCDSQKEFERLIKLRALW